jgi:calcium binding protein 39
MFQGRKDVAQIFNNMLRRQIGTRAPTVDHLGPRKEILLDLMKG